jgi:hypothetical protein
VIEEDERPDHAAACGGEQPADVETTEVAAALVDDEFDHLTAIGGGRVTAKDGKQLTPKALALAYAAEVECDYVCKRAKFFCFFFSKKKAFLTFSSRPMPRDRQAQAVERERGADQRKMRVGLREVADQPLRRGVVFLGEQADIVA